MIESLGITGWESVGIRPKRVLVIDDEADVRAVVRGCLEDLAGWSVTTASTGLEGIEKVLAERPDAIVLDMMMPAMDGIAFLTQLKAHPDLSSIPVVLLTAKMSLSELIKQHNLGVVGAIAKPFNPISLAEQIASYLGWSKEL